MKTAGLKRLKNFFTLSRKLTATHALFCLLALGCSKDDNSSSTDDIEIVTDDTTTPPSQETTLNLALTQTYGGSDIDTFQAVVATADGGAIAIGHSQSINGDIVDNDTQINKVWVVKTDSNQNIEWSKTYGGSDDDRGTDIIETSDGGYALVGYSKSADGDLTENMGFYDHWVVKLSSAGALEWQKSFGFSGSDQAFSIIQTADGGYFTSGFLDVSASEGEGNDGFTDGTAPLETKALQHGVGEYWGHQLDSNGNLLWRRYFGGSNNDRAYACIAANDDGVLLVGASESTDFDISSPKGSYDFWAVRVNAQGTLLWEKSFGGSEIDNAYAVTKTQDGNYVLAGDTRSNDGDVSNFRGNADVWLVKINDSGTLLWEKTLGGSNFDSARGICALAGGGLILTGSSRSADDQVSENNGQNDIWVVLTDDEGNLLDQQVIGGNNLDFGYSVSANVEGAVFIAGDTQSTNGALSISEGLTDGVLLKLNAQ